TSVLVAAPEQSPSCLRREQWRRADGDFPCPDHVTLGRPIVGSHGVVVHVVGHIVGVVPTLDRGDNFSRDDVEFGGGRNGEHRRRRGQNEGAVERVEVGFNDGLVPRQEGRERVNR